MKRVAQLFSMSFSHAMSCIRLMVSIFVSMKYRIRKLNEYISKSYRHLSKTIATHSGMTIIGFTKREDLHGFFFCLRMRQ